MIDPISYGQGASSAWANAVAAAINGQLGGVFADASARDAEIDTPTAGMVAYLTTPKWLTIYDGTAWIPLNGGGVVGHASATSNQTPVTSEVDLTGLSVNWTAVSTHLYRTELIVPITSTAADALRAKITDGSNNQKQSDTLVVPTASLSLTLRCFVVETGLSGSVTRKGRVIRQSGSGTVTVLGSTTTPAQITVEDLGPA